MTSSLLLSDVHWAIGDNTDGLLVRKDQEITSEFLNQLADERLASKAPAKDYHKLASIPVVVVEKWLREGFDIYRESAQAILKKLRDEDLTAFIATSKRV
jgi:hypothetical protein